MNCAAFELWLDATGGAEPTPAMHAHVGTCGRCRNALAAARSIDAALAAGPLRAPAGFAARVMSQVTSPVGVAGRDLHLAQSAILAHAGAESPAIASWWRMFLTDPAFLFALCCAVLAAWLPGHVSSSFALSSEWLQSYARLASVAMHAIPAPQSAVARASLVNCAAFGAAAGAAILARWTDAKSRHR